MDIVIYHNPACGTSRNALELIRHVGIEPHVVQYLKTPPSRTMVAWLAERAGKPLRNLLREKGTPFAELGLGDPGLTDDQLLDAIEAHPHEELVGGGEQGGLARSAVSADLGDVAALLQGAHHAVDVHPADRRHLRS